jgi:serum/glucocorticoid-regulated kinase 2
MKCVNPSLGKLVQETVVFECQLVKYNHVNKRQERLLVVSEKFIYNILPNETFFSRFSSSYRLRRKIGLEKVTGVTMSQSGFEFVIHIPGEHDYRYSSSEHKEQAVSSLCQAYCRLTGKKGLSVFLKPELTLEKYTTTKTDAKKAVSRMPTEGGVQLDSLEGLKAGDKDSVVFSRDGRKMSL